jgi:hypothetical protein
LPASTAWLWFKAYHVLNQSSWMDPRNIGKLAQRGLDMDQVGACRIV